MTTFKHDSQGFLVGELLDVNRELLDAQAAGMAVWRGIRSDVKAIAHALGVQARMSASAAKLQLRATADSSRRTSAKAPNEGSAHSRGASGQFVRQVATPAGRAGNGAARAAGGGVGTQRTASAAERAQSNTSTTTVTPAGRHRVRTAGLDTPVTPDAVDTRDALGRFTGGGKSSIGGDDGTGDKGEQDGMGLLTNAIGKLGDSLDGADQLDPTITAMKEVKEVVGPLGRGMFSMFGRTADRKKEAWHKRLLKAITGKKDAPGGGMGGGESVKSGSFMGTLMGELAPKMMLFIMPILTAIGGVLLGGLALLGGVKLGEFIYKWLTDSGLMAKIFDAVDAAKQVILSAADWGKKKYEAAKTAVVGVVNDFKGGAKEQTDPAPGAPAKLPPAKSLVQSAGRFVGGVKQLFKKGSNQERALETGASYAAGNIGNLSDAQTRALVASTALTESGGGKLGVVNEAGYMGPYQAGAGWLADAGLIKGGAKGVKSAMARDGFNNEYKWGKSGGMTKFLKNKDNWGGGLSYDAYLKSPEAQDLAFKTNSDAAYKSLMANPNVKDKSPENIAGLLKARHIAGMTGAIKVARGGTGAVDANGTSARKYYNDVAQDKDGFLAAYTGTGTVNASAARIPPVSIPSAVPERIAPAPDAAIPAQLNNAKQAPVNVSMREPIGQDVGDRSIAHVVSGGLGHIG
ncbi:hypothetical protein [Polaromonas glacialis]|uniref:hypothetical protein n=1 Tax=Polaromonas glacialis TaxID=866564 RepID=UPI00068E2A2B|nr:hypothetical protein [Polaromonas glacialis]